MDPYEVRDIDEPDVALGYTLDTESLFEDEFGVFEEDDEYADYEPGFFARLAANRPLVILLVIAFLLLILGPSLYYFLYRPRPRPPRRAPSEEVLVLRDRTGGTRQAPGPSMT